VRRAAGKQGHKMGNGLHVLMGAPTACVTDAIASHRGSYYACSPAVHWPAPSATTTTVLWRGSSAWPVPEDNFWTLWCKRRLTEADTPTIRLGATLSGPTSAHLHYHPVFYRPDALPVAQPTVWKHWGQQQASSNPRKIDSLVMSGCWAAILTVTHTMWLV